MQGRAIRGVVPEARLIYRAKPTETGKDPMANLKLTLTEDEAEILVDALEADLEGYVEAAKEARGNNNREDVKTFTEAAERIQTLLSRVQALLGD